MLDADHDPSPPADPGRLQELKRDPRLVLEMTWLPLAKRKRAARLNPSRCAVERPLNPTPQRPPLLWRRTSCVDLLVTVRELACHDGRGISHPSSRLRTD